MQNDSELVNSILQLNPPQKAMPIQKTTMSAINGKQRENRLKDVIHCNLGFSKTGTDVSGGELKPVRPKSRLINVKLAPMI